MRVRGEFQIPHSLSEFLLGNPFSGSCYLLYYIYYLLKIVINLFIIFPNFSNYPMGVLKAKLFSMYIITLVVSRNFSMDINPL